MYFVHPSTDISVDISTDSRPMYRSTYRWSIGRYVDRHIGRESLDMSTEMCWSTYRPTYRSSIGRYVDRHLPICWLIRRPRVIVQLSADMSIDKLPTFRRYFTATFPGCVTWNKIHIASYHYLRTFWERCLLLPASQRILCINPA